MKTINSYNLKLMCLCGLFVGLGVIFPMAFHAVGLVANQMFLPMHIPVLLCGFVCGWRYGFISGLIVPFLSSLFTTMPPLYPVAVSMSFELAVYGMTAGLFFKRFNVYLSLLAAMLCGRIMMGLANVVLIGLGEYSMEVFLTSAFVTSIWGIAIQLIAIPAIILTLKRLHLIPKAPLKVEIERETPAYFLEIAEKLKTLPKGAKVAIDGMSCSGKTMLCNFLSTALNCCVVHIDDFYLPYDQQTNDLGGNINFEALNSVIEKLGTSFNYDVFDCQTQESGLVQRTANKADLYILEGTYSSHNLVKANYEYIIQLNVDEKMQLQRLQKRLPEQEHIRQFVAKWLPRERMYLHSSSRRKADVVYIDV